MERAMGIWSRQSSPVRPGFLWWETNSFNAKKQAVKACFWCIWIW
jgi:hypothetical protein